MHLRDEVAERGLALLTNSDDVTKHTFEIKNTYS